MEVKGDSVNCDFKEQSKAIPDSFNIQHSSSLVYRNLWHVI